MFDLIFWDQVWMFGLTLRASLLLLNTFSIAVIDMWLALWPGKAPHSYIWRIYFLRFCTCLYSRFVNAQLTLWPWKGDDIYKFKKASSTSFTSLITALTTEYLILYLISIRAHFGHHIFHIQMRLQENVSINLSSYFVLSFE